MAVNTEYRDYVLDMLEPLGEVSARRFGERGVMSHLSCIERRAFWLSRVVPL